ncbi:MAG: hypothetical protein PF503_25680 [Desulfobacula sp.]|jgi:hypothetical protein|nr:hypothetical protein [Desulfobacula sp.]
MGKYLMHWQLNRSLLPVDPQERGKGFAALMALVKQDIKRGITKDWGCYVGEGRGYCVVEGSEVDIFPKWSSNIIHFVYFQAIQLLPSIKLMR